MSSFKEMFESSKCPDYKKGDDVIIACINYNYVYSIGGDGKNKEYILVGHNPVGSSFNFEEVKTNKSFNVGGGMLSRYGVTYIREK